MGEVVKLYPPGAAKNPDAVLEQAVGQYDTVLVLGYDDKGALDVRASTNWKRHEIAFAAQTFLHKLFNGDYDDD